MKTHFKYLFVLISFNTIWILTIIGVFSSSCGRAYFEKFKEENEVAPDDSSTSNKADSNTISQWDSETDISMSTEIDSQNKNDSDSFIDTVIGTSSENDTTTIIDTVNGTDTGVDTSSVIDTDSGFDTGVDTNSDTGVDTNSDTNTEADTVASIPCQIERCNTNSECSSSSNILHLRDKDAMAEIPHHSVLDMTSPHTIEFWFCLNSYNGFESLLRKHKSSGEDKQFSVNSSSNTVEATFWIGPGESTKLSLETTGSIPLSTWTHIAVVYVGFNVELYINGEFRSSSGNFTPIQNSSGPLYLGASIIDSGLFEGADASIAEVRISSNARYTSSFIPAVDFTVDGNTTALWKLNEGGGTTVNDMGPNALNGTLSGGYIWGK